MGRFYGPTRCPEGVWRRQTNSKCPSRSDGGQVDAFIGIRLPGETMEARESSDKVIAAKDAVRLRFMFQDEGRLLQ